MKKRILFVDDEILILEGLQRMLRPMRDEWEMEFFANAAVALERMHERAFDVVVSDMHMPGMSGAEFLGRVMRLFPQTVRLILSGHADREHTLRCVGSTHQFLAKPCEPDAFKATVCRAVATHNALQNDAIKSLVGRMSHLPSTPTLYTEIIGALQNPEVSIQTIGEIVGRDIGMTAQLMKLVNSAFFGLRCHIASPAEAAQYLGLDTLRALVLSLHAFSQFQPLVADGFSYSTLWSHSLEVAALARALAQSETTARRLADEAFVAGLLHDAGKVVLAANFPDRYAEVERRRAESGCDAHHAEHGVFGASHADIGGYLFGLWGLPVPVVDAIRLHHHPVGAADVAFSPLTAVQVADMLVGRDERTGPARTVRQPDDAYLAELGLSARLPAWQRVADRLASNLIIK